MPAILLQMPMNAMRCAALSIGPRIEMYGFAAVCSNESPAPITNRPVNAPGYQRLTTNSPNTSAPSAMTTSPIAMPLFMPVRFRIHDAGSARKKYER